MQGALSGRTRELVRFLVPACKARAEAERAASEARKLTIAAAQREHRAAVEAAEAVHSEASVKARRDRAAKDAQLDEVYAKELAEAQAERDQEIKLFREATDRLEAKAQKKLEESQWLAETLAESGETKAASEFDQSATEKKNRDGEIDTMVAKAGELLRGAGHGELPAGDSSAVVGDAGPAGLAGRVAACRDALVVLEARVKPAVLRLSSILILFIVLILGGAVGLGVAWKSAGGAGIGAGAGAVLAVLIALALRAALRGRVPAAAKGFADRVSAARTAIESMMRDAEAAKQKTIEEAHGRRDKELAKGQRKYEEAIIAVKARREEDEPALIERHQAAENKLNRRSERRRQEIGEEFDSEAGAATTTLKAALDAAGSVLAHKTSGAEAAFTAAMSSARAAWTDAMARVSRDQRALNEIDRELSPAWDAVEWANWTPREATPAGSRFGRLVAKVSDLPGGEPSDDDMRRLTPASVDLPALLDFHGTGSLLVQTGPEGRAAAVRILQATMLRLLTTFPPGKLRFTIIDPVGLGQSFAGFMHLADHDELLVHDKIWTDARHIEQKLTDITEHMEAVIQKYLRNEFSTIQEYNARAGEVAEPFRFVVIADFPANFTEAAARRLASIVTSGPRCGVYTLVATDTRQRPPAWAPIAELESSSVVLSARDGKVTWNDPDFGAFTLVPEEPPADPVVTSIAHAVGAKAKDAGRVQVPFDTVAPQPGKLWTRDSSGDLRIPLGKAGATKIQELILGRGTSQHVLIAGRTGSGKSTLLHAIITSAMLWYSPEELELYLVDFKKGVEFKTYASHRVPHARVIAVESEREFGLSVLRRLDAELTRRGQLYRELGAQDIAGFRKLSAGKHGPMPRILLMVDEFQEFFTEDDKLAQEAMLLMDRLVRQGRAFGMHVILGSQTIGGAYSLARSTIGQMGVRIALQCSEADSYLILSEDNAAARLLSRPGEAIYNDQSGMVEGNSPFQIVWVPDEARDRRLDELEALAESTNKMGEPPIVFEGNIPAKLERNHQLRGLYQGSAALTLPTIWLGDPISIKEPTCVRLRRQSGANLLVVGQQEHSTAGVLGGVLASLSPQVAEPIPGGPPRITLLDGGTGDADTNEGLRACATPGVMAAYSGRAGDEAIGVLYEELRRRQGDSGQAPAVFLVVAGLQRFRSLRRSEDDFGFSGSDGETGETKADKRFAALLRDGPGVGIFTIVSVDTSTNLDRAVDRRLLKEFDFRVLFQMSANDSTNIIDTTAAGNLGANRGLLYSEETGQVEKFRPYAVPDAEALAGLRLGHRPVVGSPS